MNYGSEEKSVDGGTIRQRNQSILPNRRKLAESGNCAGCGQEVRPPGRLLGDSRGGSEHGTPEARAEGGKEKRKEISVVFTSIPPRKPFERRCIRRTEAEQAICRLYEKIRNAFYQHRIRARRAGVENTLTLPELLQIMAGSKGVCCYCERLVGIENLGADHVIPIAKGGANSAFNMTASCLSCNCRKGVNNWA